MDSGRLRPGLGSVSARLKTMMLEGFASGSPLC